MREHRIFGPPGTGKTTRLAAEIKSAYSKFGEAIMIASFTKTAAAELVGRDLPIPRNRIGTLHSFCYRFQEAPDIADTPQGIEEWNSQPEAASRGWRLRGGTGLDDPYSGAGIDVLSELGRLRGLLVPRERMPSQVQAFAEAWGEWKTERKLVDFTDLIDLELKEGAGLPFDVAVGFFDEVQDFTPLELALVRKWGAGMRHFILAGDDDQAIYGFRGAVPDGFLDPPLPDDQKTILSKSWRLSRRIKEFADDWIVKVKRRELKPFEPILEGGEIFRKPFGYSSKRQVVDAIEEDLCVEGRTVMLLASCGYMLDACLAELRKRGLPFANPYRNTNGRWSPLRGGAERLRNFLAKTQTWKQVWSWVELLDASLAGLKRGSKTAVKEMLVEDASTVVDDTVFALLGIEEENIRNPDWFKEKILASRQAMLAYAFAVFQAHGEAALVAKPRITVGTFHSVKGGEADSVHLFPDMSRASAVSKQLLGAEGEDSIRRLFYVGMTRARRKLTIYNATGKLYARLA